jgi:transcriptional regulator with XRE-family HTH domain
MFDNVTIKDVKIQVGLLVKTLRNRDSLTQEQLAEKLSLSRVTIQNLESGQNPTMDTLLKVLQYFDLLGSFNSYIETEIQNNNQQSLY